MENIDVLDREKLREERRIRNKQKREINKLEKQKEKEKLRQLYDVRPQGANVSIITQHFANFATGTQNINNINNDLNELHLTENDFPLIGEASKTTSHNKSESTVTPLVKNDSKKNNKSININIIDLINSETQQKSVQNSNSNHSNNIYQGNPLDSSQPIRKKGKHNENRVKKQSKLKTSIIEQIHSNNINEANASSFIYCNNTHPPELEEATKVFLAKIVNFQEKLYSKNQLKGKIKRRYVVGFHETKKYLKLGKMQVLILAKDIKVLKEHDSLHTLIKDMVDTAKQESTEYFFALTRRKLGTITKKNVPISCIGIFNYDGAQEEYKVLEREYNNAKYLFEQETERDKNNIITDLIENAIATLRD